MCRHAVRDAEFVRHRSLVRDLAAIVGRRHVITSARATARFRSGYRTGGGAAIAVVRPGTLVEQWRVAQTCVAAGASIIMQASNTGLTGGSTPDGDDYPGGVVIVSTTRIGGLHLIRNGEQAICLAGTTLHQLERALRPLGREPHSVIGSSCFGATVVGGICNNSGGALIRRGPAFTQLSLFARIEPDGSLRLVNHLGVWLGEEAEDVLGRLDEGRFTDADVAVADDRWAHDHAYADHVRKIDDARPARFNADPRCLFEGSGSAGKLIVFAVRVDTFAAELDPVTFYIGTNDPDQLTAIRRTMLGGGGALPIAAEYMHRTAFDVADRYGRDMFLAIAQLGTDRLPALLAAKARIDDLAKSFLGANLSDRLMQALGRLLPDHLPMRMREFRNQFEHHLILKLSADARTEQLLIDTVGADGVFRCTPEESAKAFLHRFVAAGAAIRYRAIHADDVEDIVAMDVALPRNALVWQETLTPTLAAQTIHVLYYGHFFCHVFHQDYIVAKGNNVTSFNDSVHRLLDARGAEYPAEHNVGHLYHAKPALKEFYRSVDPCNQLNPGIGHTSRMRHWSDASPLLSSHQD